MRISISGFRRVLGRVSPSLVAVLATMGAGPAAVAGDTSGTTGPADPPPHAIVAELPFERPSRSNRIYVNLAEDDEKPLVLLLDTGAQGSVMTPVFARRQGISVRRAKSSPYRRGTRLGRDLQFWISDRLSDAGSRTGWE